MTRKESGFVELAMAQAAWSLQYAREGNTTDAVANLDALRAHLTSLQSAAEGLEEALPDEAQAEHWRSLGDRLMNEQRTGPMLREAAMQLQNAYLAATAMRAALSAFNSIKGK